LRLLRSFVLGLVLCGVTLGYGSAAYAHSNVAFQPSSSVNGSFQPGLAMAVAQLPCSDGSYCAAWIAATAAVVAAGAAVVQAAAAVAAVADSSSSSSSSSSGSIHFSPPTAAQAATARQQYVAFMEHDFDH
jgi:hypothetical protein